MSSTMMHTLSYISPRMSQMLSTQIWISPHYASFHPCWPNITHSEQHLTNTVLHLTQTELPTSYSYLATSYGATSYPHWAKSYIHWATFCPHWATVHLTKTEPSRFFIHNGLNLTHSEQPHALTEQNLTHIVQDLTDNELHITDMSYRQLINTKLCIIHTERPHALTMLDLIHTELPLFHTDLPTYYSYWLISFMLSNLTPILFSMSSILSSILPKQSRTSPTLSSLLAYTEPHLTHTVHHDAHPLSEFHDGVSWISYYWRLSFLQKSKKIQLLNGWFSHYNLFLILK